MHLHRTRMQHRRTLLTATRLLTPRRLTRTLRLSLQTRLLTKLLTRRPKRRNSFPGGVEFDSAKVIIRRHATQAFGTRAFFVVKSLLKKHFWGLTCRSDLHILSNVP